MSDDLIERLRAQRTMSAGGCQDCDDSLKQEAADELSRLRDQAREAGWRPIDSAPKDGTLVDLWGSYGHYEFRQCGFRWRDSHWLNEDGENASDYPNYIYTPTHWMPLPAPPAQEPKDEG